MRSKVRQIVGKFMFLGVMGAALLALPVGVSAKTGDVIRTGSCSGSTDWKLKASPDNGRIELEFEVDSNVNGQTWKVTLKHNGNAFWTGARTTQAPSGSFTVRKLTNNAAGSDTFVGRAVNQSTGEVCRGSLTF